MLLKMIEIIIEYTTNYNQHGSLQMQPPVFEIFFGRIFFYEIFLRQT